MKQMKNSITIGAAALFALTGCVADVSYVPQDSDSEECAEEVSYPEPVVIQQEPIIAQQTQQVLPQQNYPQQVTGPVDMSQGGGGLDDGLPTNVQPGECYSRCLAPAVYEDVQEEIEVSPAREKTEIIPAAYDWVNKEVLVKEASEKIKTIPAKYDWREEQVLVRDESEELRAIPARYEWREETVTVKDASENLRSVPAKYDWRNEQVQVSPEVVNITISNPGFSEVREQVLVKAPSAKWIKKATHCTPDDVRMGLTDCDTLCYVAVPALYKTVIKKIPNDCSGKIGGCRQEVVIPPEYKTVRTKVVVEPARTETISIPPEYKTIRKEVIVEPARTESVVVPAKYKNVRKKVVVEPARTETISVPAEYKTIKVKQIVQEAQERTTSIPPEYRTITKKVKVSDSKIVWRAALCEDKAVDTKIKQVQNVLSQEGFYSGVINGIMTRSTKDGVRDYQMQNGLPQGGGLTIETLEMMGIY